MASTILGWTLVILGGVAYISGVASYIKERFFPQPGERALLPAGISADLEAITKLLEQVANVLTTFSKLSIPVQWSLLGLATIALGAYLLATKPF